MFAATRVASRASTTPVQQGFRVRDEITAAGAPRSRHPGMPAGTSAARGRTTPPTDLVVSIINYRTPELTIACLRSVLDDAPAGNAGVVVIDNASGDGSPAAIRDWIARHAPDAPVTLMESATNLGFAGGHNAVMAAHPAAFHLLVNSDTQARPGAIATLRAAAEANPRAGLITPALEDPDGTRQISCFRFHTPASELIRGAASGPVTRLLARHEVPLGTAPAPGTIDWVSFACVLIRAEARAAAGGGLDDGFFLYYEDAEFCRRIRHAGWTIAHVPEARVVHFRGGSGPVKALSRQKRRLPRYYYESRARYFRKAHGRAGLLAANLCWLAGRTIAQTRRLAGRPVPQTRTAEWRDIWTGFLRRPGG